MAVRMTSMALAVVLVVASATALLGSAQEQAFPPCTAKLDGCAAYLNSTSKFPDGLTCCNPVWEMVRNEFPCFCQLLNTAAFFQQRHLNHTLTVGLPKRCGAFTFNITRCDAYLAAPSPAPSSLGNAAVTRTANTWIRLPILITLYLFGWSVLS